MSITRRASLAIAAAATALSLFGATASAQTASAQTARTETVEAQTIRHFYETFNTGDANLLDLVLAEDWVHIPAAPGEEPGRDGFKPMVPAMMAAFADATITIEEIVQEGNRLAVRSTFTATQAGPFMGFESKGRPFTIMTIDIHEFNDEGLVQTTWHLEDWLGALFQMGAFEQ